MLRIPRPFSRPTGACYSLIKSTSRATFETRGRWEAAAKSFPVLRLRDVVALAPAPPSTGVPVTLFSNHPVPSSGWRFLMSLVVSGSTDPAPGRARSSDGVRGQGNEKQRN